MTEIENAGEAPRLQNKAVSRKHARHVHPQS